MWKNPLPEIALLLCLAAGSLSVSVALADVPVLHFTTGDSDDSWETDTFFSLMRDNIAQGQCALSDLTIDSALIAPVPIAMRSTTAEQLRDIGIVPLQPSDAARLLNIPATSYNEVAGAVARDAITELEARRRLAVEDRKGSWSRADQNRLDALYNVRQDPSVRAFLVRALIARDQPNGYLVTRCRESIFVRHLSYGGQASSPPQRAPIILFLNFAPTTAYVTWLTSP